jgi:hypothetical protein
MHHFPRKYCTKNAMRMISPKNGEEKNSYDAATENPFIYKGKARVEEEFFCARADDERPKRAMTTPENVINASKLRDL